LPWQHPFSDQEGHISNERSKPYDENLVKIWWILRQFVSKVYLKIKDKLTQAEYIARRLVCRSHIYNSLK